MTATRAAVNPTMFDPSALELLRRFVPIGLSICVMQALAPVSYAFASTRLGWRAKLAVLGAFAGLIFALASTDAAASAVILELAIALAYFAALSLGFYGLCLPTLRTRFSRSAVFGIAAFAFLLVPSLFVSGAVRFPLLLWGWERMFSAYSLWAEASTMRRTPAWREAVTFVTVNPCLVFPKRGTISGSPRLRVSAVLRVGLGLLAITLHLLVIAIFSDRAQFVDLPALLSLDGYARFTGYMGARAFEIYCIHSGAASMTLGLFALLGYELPERYRYPFMASSPVDFWRRWNLYVADWFKHYVFNPSALRMMRSRPRANGTAKALAVLLTFAACGAAHEYVLYLKAFSAGIGLLLAFLFQGCVVLLWLGMERGFDTLRLRVHPLFQRVAHLGARVVFYHLLFVTLWLAIPALSGWGLPPSLQRLLSDWTERPT